MKQFCLVSTSETVEIVLILLIAGDFLVAVWRITWIHESLIRRFFCSSPSRPFHWLCGKGFSLGLLVSIEAFPLIIMCHGFIQIRVYLPVLRVLIFPKLYSSASAEESWPKKFWPMQFFYTLIHLSQVWPRIVRFLRPNDEDESDEALIWAPLTTQKHCSGQSSKVTFEK